jgi:hypothetical protein
MGDHLQITLATRPLDGQEHLRRDIIQVAHTPCHLGGTRPWFICPRPDCGRRVAMLYDHGGFACRHCHRLAYPSQRESTGDRAFRKADRIRQRLGWESWECSATGRKPKGMHDRTFRRLRTQRACLMIQALGEAGRQMDSISRSLDGRNSSKHLRAQALQGGGNIGGNKSNAI